MATHRYIWAYMGKHWHTPATTMGTRGTVQVPMRPVLFFACIAEENEGNEGQTGQWCMGADRKRACVGLARRGWRTGDKEMKQQCGGLVKSRTTGSGSGVGKWESYVAVGD